MILVKLIAGLGNPGEKYSDTRHNVGFRAIKVISDNFEFNKPTFQLKALVASGNIKKDKVILAQPLSYMNSSGKVVKRLVDYYKISLDNLIIIYDDLDLDTGDIRIKTKGSSGGHNGIKSVINWLGSRNIPRIRIGIGRPQGNISITDYVLSKFNIEEEKKIKKAIEKVIEAVEIICEDNFDMAMNKFN
ncbi:MAG: aminoacyl-tRNA hydrolase [Halanaerobiales bacterium]